MEKWKKKIQHCNTSSARIMSFIFPDTKHFTDKKLERKCAKENISVEQVIYFSLLYLYIGNERLSLTLNIVLICGLLYNKKSCEATIIEAKR